MVASAASQGKSRVYLAHSPMNFCRGAFRGSATRRVRVRSATRSSTARLPPCIRPQGKIGVELWLGLHLEQVMQPQFEHFPAIFELVGKTFLVPLPAIAELINWHPQSIRNSISQGQFPIPHFKVGGKIFFRTVDFAAFLDDPNQFTHPVQTAASAPPVIVEKRGRGRPRKYTASVVGGGLQ